MLWVESLLKYLEIVLVLGQNGHGRDEEKPVYILSNLKSHTVARSLSGSIRLKEHTCGT